MIADETCAITGHCGRLLLELAILQLDADPKKRSPEDVWVLFLKVRL